MVREGWIAPLPHLSHLATDGPGAMRYGLTRTGRRARERLRKSLETHLPLTGEIPRAAATAPAPPAHGVSAGVTPRLSPPVTAPPSGRQEHYGVGNLWYTMLIEAPFRRPFGWAREYPMGPGRGTWVKRHSPFGRGIHLEESGGTRWDPPGIAGHTLTVKFAVKGKDPEANEAEAERVVEDVRRTLETEYGCTLSEPLRRGPGKWHVRNDPMARAIREAGIAVHGKVGVDDTPEPATLEFDAAEAVRSYAKGVAALPDLLVAVAALRAEVAELRAANVAMVEGQVEQTKALREVVERLRPPKVEPPPPLGDPGRAGYG